MSGVAPAEGTHLRFDDLLGGYGSAAVVRAVSGSVGAGEALCVVGRNGVGKTTLMRLLLGYLPCWEGRIALKGREIQSLEPTQRHALGISYCPQERPVFDDLSVRDNLTLMRERRSVDAFEPYFRRFPVLSRRLGQRAGTLSGGEKKLLSFTRGLAEALPLVVLDEPTEGVQWENVLQMIDAIGDRKSEGTAFVVVEQNLAFAERIADRYLVIDQGRVMLDGTREQIGRDALLAHLHV